MALGLPHHHPGMIGAKCQAVPSVVSFTRAVRRSFSTSWAQVDVDRTSGRVSIYNDAPLRFTKVYFSIPIIIGDPF